ncbi:MAG TPA: DUF6152 family protein [Gammaproteobacteria bacterium]
MYLRRAAFWVPAIGVVVGLAAGRSEAHHGPSVEPLYDTSALVELEGEVTEVFWRNPHVRFRIRVTAGAESGEIWELEMNPINILARAGLNADLLRQGDAVKVAGVVSRRNPRHMALHHLLLPNGLEFAGRGESRELRFSDRRLSLEALPMAEATIEAARLEADGIFRVWARGPEYGVGSMRSPRHDDANLTEAALAAKAAFDPAEDPIMTCVPDGMPRSMMHPSSVEFIDEGDRILLLVQEHDLVRTIHMGSVEDSGNVPATPLGYSVGRWEGGTLVVTTTRIDWPYSDGNGVPQSPDAEHVERFTLSADGSRLDYEMISTDPAYLREPAVRGGHWEWLPGVELRPYECAVWENNE